MMFLNTLILAVVTLGDVVPEPADTSIYKTEKIDEVVVTDFKVNKRNLTSTAKSTADEKLIQNQQITSLKELTAVLPNFYMPDYGSRSSTPVYIRGIGAKTKGSAVGFYVDGVPYNEPSAFDIDLSDIASVEVLRGPQGTLFGRNAIGGIINVFNHNPLDYQKTRIKVGYGKYNDVITQFSTFTKISQQFGVHASATYHHNDGMFKNAFLGEKVDDMDEGQGYLGFYWRPAQNWQLRLTSSLSYSDQGGYPYAPYDTEKDVLAEISYNRYSVFRRLVSTNGFNVRYNGRGFSLNSQTSYQFIKSHQGIDQDFTPEDKSFVDNDYHQNMLSQELTLKSNHMSRYQWVTGVFGMLFHTHKFTQNNVNTKGYATPTTSKEPLQTLAFYHQSSYNIWKGLSATIGLRVDYEHAKIDYYRDKLVFKTNTLTHVTDFVSKDHFFQVTPKFTLQYLTTGKNLFYANVTRGYKPGGFNNSFVTDTYRDYDPEYSWNYEVGTRLNILPELLTLEADFFYIDWRHMQITTTVLGEGNLTTNSGHTDSKGFELSLNCRPVKGLDFQVSYGYTYARFLSYKKSEDVDYTGNKLPMVPSNTLGINGSYTVLPHGWLDKLVLSMGLTGLGKIYWAEDNAVCQDFYAVLNAKVSATKGIFTWELWGKNLTDTEYMAYGFKSSTGNYAQRGKPLTFGTSLAINF